MTGPCVINVLIRFIRECIASVKLLVLWSQCSLLNIQTLKIPIYKDLYIDDEPRVWFCYKLQGETQSIIIKKSLTTYPSSSVAWPLPHILCCYEKNNWLKIKTKPSCVNSYVNTTTDLYRQTFMSPLLSLYKHLVKTNCTTNCKILSQIVNSLNVLSSKS